jgi:hypothetical protein
LRISALASRKGGSGKTGSHGAPDLRIARFTVATLNTKSSGKTPRHKETEI